MLCFDSPRVDAICWMPRKSVLFCRSMSCIDSSCFVYICLHRPILSGSFVFPRIFAEGKPWPTDTGRWVVWKRYLADPVAPAMRPYNRIIQVLTGKADAPFLWRAGNKGCTRREAPTLGAIRREG